MKRRGFLGFLLSAPIAVALKTPSQLPPSPGLTSLKRTDVEIAAGVMPVNYTFEPGDVRRYGGVFDGVTDDGPAWQRAVDFMTLDLGGRSVKVAYL